MNLLFKQGDEIKAVVSSFALQQFPLLLKFSNHNAGNSRIHGGGSTSLSLLCTNKHISDDTQFLTCVFSRVYFALY